MPLSTKQSGVIKGVIGGFSITVVLFTLSVFALVLPFQIETSANERIIFSLKADLLVVFWLIVSVGRVAQQRFFTPEDIDGGGLSQGSERAKILQSILQNTLEQAVLAIFIHTAWALIMPAAWLPVILTAAILFFCGRLLFTYGYANGAPARALGFALTFYPSVLMFLILLFKGLF